MAKGLPFTPTRSVRNAHAVEFETDTFPKRRGLLIQGTVPTLLPFTEKRPGLAGSPLHFPPNNRCREKPASPLSEIALGNQFEEGVRPLTPTPAGGLKPPIR